MLKFPISRGQAGRAPPDLHEALDAWAPLPAAEQADKMRQYLRRLPDAPLDAQDRLSVMRALSLAMLRLPERDAGAALRRVWEDLHRESKALAFASAGPTAEAALGRKLRQQAIELALASAWRLARLLLADYAAWPPGFWRDCHQLYAEARQLGVERGFGNGLESPDASYRKLLLLGISHGHRLERARLLVLVAWLQKHGEHLRLREEAASGWRVIPAEDAPGRFNPDGGHVGLGMDCGLVLQRARRALEANAEQATALEWQLLSLLEREWSGPPQRRHARAKQRNGQRVQWLRGFDACWRLAREGGMASVEETGCLLVANLSASGMRLQGDLAGSGAMAGDVLMLKRRGFGWQLALLRWLALPDGEQPGECGVEFVGKRPQAVEAAALTSHGDAALEPALLLYAERRFFSKGVLLMPGRLYQAMRPFRVRGADGEWLVRAEKLLQQTGSCQLISVRLEEKLA
ncbi:hypothetical protein [Chromobacterium alticapitis]|nr:hypothetical protein [Chromobacterium alticapitis]